jgi:hypothetical protein
MATNPYLPVSATGNASQTDFTFTFPYLNALHVKATLNGVLTTAFTFFSATVLRFNTAPGSGVAIRIFRDTPGDAISTVIQPGGPLPVVGLNNNFLQGLYYNQEVAYDAANQSTAGLQAQITTATNTANAAAATAGQASIDALAAVVTANSISGSKANRAGDTFTGDVIFSTTTGTRLPRGTTAQRPTPTGNDGLIRYNSQLNQYEGVASGIWNPIAGSARGGGTDAVFLENDITVTTDYTLTANRNAVSAGPVTIQSGATVTIPSGATWTIV